MSAIGNALLHVNVVIAYLKRDLAVRSQCQLLTTLYLPLTASGKPYYGAFKSGRPDPVPVQIRDLLRVMVLLAPNDGTADHYGQIKAELAWAGTPIPQNDLWIAALVKQYQLPLATRDRHFQLRFDQGCIAPAPPQAACRFFVNKPLSRRALRHPS